MATDNVPESYPKAISKRESIPKQSKNDTSKPKASLADQLGRILADELTMPRKDTDALSIVQRLHRQQHTHTEPITAAEILNELKLPARPIDLTQSLNPGVNGSAPEYSTSCVSVDLESSSGKSTASSHGNSPRRQRNSSDTFSLEDFKAMTALGVLAEKYGRVCHMGILDPSYSFFICQDRQAALYYKVRNNIAVVGGDPLCDISRFHQLLEEFQALCRKKRWGIAFLGATDSFAAYSRSRKWVTMRFGTERNLNPLDNPVLQEKEQKRMATQNKQLLDPQKVGIKLHAYAPVQGRDQTLERELRAVYDAWRAGRDGSGKPQAYMTVFDPFAMPMLMTYIYTTDSAGTKNGFAALRKIGANRGYHLDPYCALPDAPRGITDLLVCSAMALLQQAGIGYLSLGFEPALQLDEVFGLSRLKTSVTKSCYRRAFRQLPVGGKKAYHDKFRPDPSLDSGLHIIYPDGTPSLQHALATLHFANIDVSDLLRRELLAGLKPMHSESWELKRKLRKMLG
jgi:hypothetical protein